MGKSLIKIASKALGDTIGAMCVIEAYREKTGDEVFVIANLDKSFFSASYPQIVILPYNDDPIYRSDSQDKWIFRDAAYDTYKEILYKFDAPLIRGYAEQLGVDSWERPMIDIEESERPIKSKYVCFSMHSTAQCKHWNYPDGWEKLCKMLRKKGYTPVCIDRYETFGNGNTWNPSPKSAVKKHGMNLNQMIRFIDHCEFFIGLSSGLSWVAHAVGKPVVMISGVTSEDNEFFEDTVRIVNKSVCHGCINKKEHKFDAGDWFWCPVHKGTSRQFECTSSITPEYVFGKMENLMGN